MLLNALELIKDELDVSFTFVVPVVKVFVGRMEMNINGRNSLACITNLPLYRMKLLSDRCLVFQLFEI